MYEFWAKAKSAHELSTLPFLSETFQVMKLLSA